MVHRAGLSDYLRSFPHPGGIIVCEERKFIYMKAPRTGGTSILRQTLEPAIPSIVHVKDAPQRFDAWRREITDDRLDDYFIFTFVRNPWDRFVSISCYLGVPIRRLARKFRELQRDDAIRTHSLPLYQYAHCGGELFVDFVGRFERLQHDFDQVAARLRLPRQPLPHASRTAHAHYSGYYDADLKQRVADIYADDLRAFEYRFERPVD